MCERERERERVIVEFRFDFRYFLAYLDAYRSDTFVLTNTRAHVHIS